MRCQTSLEYLILISAVLVLAVLAYFLSREFLSTAEQEANETQQQVHNGINNLFNTSGS